MSKKKKKRQTTEEIRYIALNMGAVETGQCGHLIFEAVHPPPSGGRLAAFKDLARTLFEHYLTDIGYGERPYLIKDCCRKASENPETEFCPRCKKDIRVVTIDFDVYQDYLWNFPIRTADECGEELEGWNPWVSIFDVVKHGNRENIIEVDSDADEYLIGVLDPILMPTGMREAWEQWRSENWHSNSDKSLECIDKGEQVLV